MTDILKTIKSCEGDIVLSKSQANSVASYIENLEQEAKLGEEYKKSLVKEVTKLCAISFPEMDTNVFNGVAKIMTTDELKSFRDSFNKVAKKNIPKPQIISNNENTKRDYSQFRI